MEIDALRNGLVDCLEQFDTAILPLGLYASDELAGANPVRSTYQEWQGAIFPFLESQGCGASRFSPIDNFSSTAICHSPSIGTVTLALVKVSNIKVRRYGSGHYVDRQENRLGRWEKADLSGQLGQLWKPFGSRTYSWEIDARIVMFISYDKAQRPFEGELEELRESTKWENKAVAYQTQTWGDKAGRGFNIRLCAWSRLAGS